MELRLWGLSGGKRNSLCPQGSFFFLLSFGGFLLVFKMWPLEGRSSSRLLSEAPAGKLGVSCGTALWEARRGDGLLLALIRLPLTKLC